MTPPKIYGLIGFPVKHSLSPAMHNAAFQALHIKAEYKLFEVNPQNLAEFVSLENFRRIGLFGCNVTIPHKENVVRYTQRQAPEVKFTDAANTLVINKRNEIEAWNTDGIGFYRHLSTDLGFNAQGKKAAILGAGGAAKAVTDQLARNGASAIRIYDVDTGKSKKLSEKLNGEFTQCRCSAAESIEDLTIQDADLLVNATPIGLKKDDPCIIDDRHFHKGLLVYDLIYNPVETPLLKKAAAGGSRVANGLGMLLYQGMRSFEIWTGCEAPKQIMSEALNERLKHV